jgi:hypothetical protein
MDATDTEQTGGVATTGTLSVFRFFSFVRHRVVKFFRKNAPFPCVFLCVRDSELPVVSCLRQYLYLCRLEVMHPTD